MNQTNHFNDSRRRRPPGARPGRGGFTTLELIGILAVMVLLSAAVAERVFHRLREEARKAEKTSLEGMAEALKSHILEARRIPAIEDLDEFIAEELEVPVQRIRNNRPGFARVFLYDPAFKVGNDAPPPYVQGVEGSKEPRNPRVLILSRLDGEVPDQRPFDTLWDTPEKTLPPGWSGDAEDLFIQRIDLRELFHRVVLASTDGTAGAPYDIASSSVQTISPGGRKDLWILDGTPITFYYQNSELQAREFLRHDVSFAFEEGRWNRHAVYGSGGWHQPFGQLVDVFLSTPPAPDAANGVTPEAVITEFYNYLYHTGMWASGDPEHGMPMFYHAGSPDQPMAPEHVIVWDAQRRLSQFTSNLIQ
jgi:type II secretory pathway pseudopilin PulG